MATYTNKLIVIQDGKLQKISASDKLEVGGNFDVGGQLNAGSMVVDGNLAVGGNLNVQGAVVSHGTENLIVSDAFIALAADTQSAVANAGGFSLTLKKADDFTPVSTVSFAAGVQGTSAPTVTVAAGHGSDFAAGDIIQVYSALDDVNNGLHAVASVSGDVLTIYGIGGVAVPSYAKFVDNQFVSGLDGAAKVAKVDLAVFAFSDGNLYADELAFPVGTPCFAYAPAAKLADFDGSWQEFGGDVSLQDAYDAGSAIALADERDLDVSKPASGTAAISLQANAASKFEVVDANLSLFTSGDSGNVSIDSVGQLSLTADAAVSVESSGGAISIGADDTDQALNLGTAGERAIAIGSANASSIDASADMVTFTANTNLALYANSGSMSLESADVASILSTGANITVKSTAAAGFVQVLAATETDLYDAAIDDNCVLIGAEASVKVDAAADSYFKVDGAALSLQTLTSGALDLTSAGTMVVSAASTMDLDSVSALSLNSSTAAINIGNDDVDQALNLGTAGERVIAIGSANAVSVSADAVTISLDASNDSNFSVASADLTLATVGATGITYVRSGQEVLIATEENDAVWMGVAAADHSANMESDNNLGAIFIGASDFDSSVNIGIGGDRQINIGKQSGDTEINLYAGSGSLSAYSDAAIVLSAADDSSFYVEGADLNIGTTTTGDLALWAAALFGVTAGSDLSLNAGGIINIGDAANAQPINVGTGAVARTITIGNVTGATALDLLAGTGGVDVTGNVDVTGYLKASSYLKVGEVAYASFPTAATAGAGSLLWDSTSVVLKYSDGSAWQTVADLNDITLQMAYDNSSPAQILLANSKNLSVLKPLSGTAAISLQANDNSKFEVVSANLDLKTTTSGAVAVTSAGAMDLDAVGALSINSSAAAIKIGDDAVAQSISLGTAGARTITIGSASATEVEVNADLVDVNSDGAITLDAAAASNFTVAGAKLTVATTTSGELALSSAGLMNVDAGADLDLDVTGNATLDATGTMALASAGTLSLTSSTAAYIKVPGTYEAGELSVVNGSNQTQLRVASGHMVMYSSLLLNTAYSTGKSGAGFVPDSVNATAGQVVCIDQDGGFMAFTAADNATAGKNEPVGVYSGNPSSGPNRIVSVPGSFVAIEFEVGTATTKGAPVYLSAVSGKATQVVPSSGRVYRLGILLDTSGSANKYPVLWMPQFIADL